MQRRVPLLRDKKWYQNKRSQKDAYRKIKTEILTFKSLNLNRLRDKLKKIQQKKSLAEKESSAIPPVKILSLGTVK